MKNIMICAALTLAGLTSVASAQQYGYQDNRHQYDNRYDNRYDRNHNQRYNRSNDFVESRYDSQYVVRRNDNTRYYTNDEGRTYSDGSRIVCYRNGNNNQVGGTVAGAVIGGLIGNQIGRGNGRKAATVAGAIGGGFAGKKIQENHQNNQYDNRTCERVYLRKNVW